MRWTRLLHKVHKWTGLLSGINVLILSITGSYLVFTPDINRIFNPGEREALFSFDAGGAAPIQTAVNELVKQQPGAKVMRVRSVEDQPGVYETMLGEGEHFLRYHVDVPKGEVRPVIEGAMQEFTHFVFDLHATLFLGIAGSFVLGAFAILFFVSTLTGILIYGPFMKQAVFGAFRGDKGVRRASADLHKLVGSAALGFNLLMAVTGIALTVGLIAAQLWSMSQVRALAENSPAREASGTLPAIDEVIAAAAKTHPDTPVDNVAFPGGFQGENHYLCYHFGEARITGYIPKLTLVPVANPAEALPLSMPLWIKFIMVCFPLHFGNFAGFWLRVVYCLFGLTSGVLAISGALLTFSAWGKRIRVRAGRKAKEEGVQPLLEETAP
jgi:uncharacterized iron-regulated membrane protein